MPSHWPESTRNAALRMLAGNGQDYTATGAEFDVPLGTLRSWVKRYGLPSDESAGYDEGEGTAAPAISPVPPTSRQPQRASGAPSHLPPLPSLVDLTRTEYLRDRVAVLERVISDLMAEERPSGSAIRQLMALQSDMHREHVEVVRTEGQQLDLSSDPTAIARAIEAEQRLLRVLQVVLEDPE